MQKVITRGELLKNPIGRRGNSYSGKLDLGGGECGKDGEDHRCGGEGGGGERRRRRKEEDSAEVSHKTTHRGSGIKGYINY